ncbi:MAG TPA: hypothetical protein VG733_09115 [Chthoniobacteraceae bacterium]|nr:hypothetical protein [Chthoniobacteraceae bacterium]
MKTALLASLAMLALLASAQAQSPKTPADWVQQLGADNLKDRDAASAALLSLGAEARDAVRDALDSKDPEVKSRAQDLWKNLRWFVVPGADRDIKLLVAEADKGNISQETWQAFVHKHGAESIRFVEEIEKLDREESALIPANSSELHQNNYYPGLQAVLDAAQPVEVARVISETDSPKDRANLMSLLDKITPANAQLKTALNWVQIQTALWNYQEAYDFGRDYSLRNPGYEMAQQCAIAVDRGAMFDKVNATAKKDIAGETDPDQLCAKLSFYTGLFVNLEKKPAIDPLYNLLPKDATAKASDASLRRLVETLLSAGMPQRAAAALHNVQSAEGLYMRSAADVQLQNEPLADADWSDAMTQLDDLDDSKKKETFYSLGELMRDWHDERAVVMWQKILAIDPDNTVYDANSCFRMGEFLEARRDYANAAEFYSKGLDIASKINNGVMVATGPDGRSVGSGQQAVLDKIRELKTRAAREKSLFNTPTSAGGGQ